MNRATASYVIDTCREINLKPGKALGQNFLIDTNIREMIINAAGLKPSDSVLEVGPGLGALTQRLVEEAGKVTAVEKDKKLFAFLSSAFEGDQKIKLINEDMLDVDFAGLSAGKLVSNLPYSSGTRILLDIICSSKRPELIVVTMQKEVGDRMSALPGSKDYGVLSLWAQLDYEIEKIYTVKPTCFWPMPAVKSEIIKLKRRECRLKDDERRLFYIVTKSAFTYRRKKLSTIFKDRLMTLKKDKIAVVLCGKENARPEELELKEWVSVCSRCAAIEGCIDPDVMKAKEFISV